MTEESNNFAEWLYSDNTISILVADPDEPKVYISDAKSRDQLDKEIDEDTELFLTHDGDDALAVLRDLCLHQIGTGGSLGESLESLLAYVFAAGREYERSLHRTDD
jgi:hypothetical protein